ncbi:unnamed protein product [Sphagnum jensenii]|uniref:Uncharacterized protein n=1 Tax=Sphagnum jensenii TaxID=128206 RepID=A0ABP0XGQ2_9BRYO
MWFRCCLLVVCLVVLLPACVTCRLFPCDDTKTGIPSMEALLQHKVRAGNIDEIISKESAKNYFLQRGSWARRAPTTAYEISTTAETFSPPITQVLDAAELSRTVNEEDDRRYLLEFRKDYEEPGPNTNHGLDPPAPTPSPLP